ncbi:unnamed protein product [Cyberlindnera jadinii]|uniref:CSI2 protein n=1 Tax=Cyberlindnera jadinii (strain ATCC 18201 / CBS 1600 / BCRC 20928 / JCM 3617 / NBRC 0987 / NRRL Y-1542) TaxID=983966 RepID=A0A0H5CAM9_CYBJN|nr:hypothetical protein CYBJADRAFT_165554 [Cyberlindnera jadinii NRRL Y-1542]ODV76245.1 hypothetical protein CYBJADRAFT_165554 [Cyberlindnera jadinii NRRL Y-1542]CEP20899.1 unnamed protein product [Cyberlindnera jadinii]
MSSSGMPTITSTTTSATKSGMPVITVTEAGSTTWTTPDITPPAAGDNPNIWRSSAPSGTVFIAVGAVAGFIMVIFALVLILRNWLARRTARESVVLDDNNSTNSFGSGGLMEKNQLYHSSSDLRKSVSQGKIPLLYSTYTKEFSNDSVADFSDPGYTRSHENIFSTLDATDNKRKSMFISPTAEVMGLKSQPPNQRHSRVLSSLSNIASTTTVNGGGSEVTSSYQTPPQVGSRFNRHERTGSYDNYGEVSLTSPERGSQREYKSRSRAVPSQYLDSMFED